jgi:RNA polymerase sigma factor (sigma-70 family)
LVRHNLRLVVSVARRYAGRGLEFSDLIQEGNLRLMSAAWGFDTNYVTKFSTYATCWIKQSIGRAIAYKASLILLPIRAAVEKRVLDDLGSNLQTKVLEARVSAGRRVRVTLAVKNYEQNILRAATVQ